MWSSTGTVTWAAALAVFCFVVAVYKVVYHYFFDPLASVPGPFSARLTRLWLMQIDLSRVGPPRLHELHRKYGPIMVVAPNEVSVNQQSDYDTIYGQRTSYLKDDDYYLQLGPPGVVTTFQEKNVQKHASGRRIFSHAFSRSNILALQPHIRNHLGLVKNHLLQAANTKNPISLYDLVGSFTLDVISKLCYGNPVGAMERPELDSPVVKTIANLGDGMLMRTHYPFLGILQLLTNLDDFKTLADAVSQSLQRLESKQSEQDGMILIESAIRRAKLANHHFPEKQQFDELMEFFFAGTGTSSSLISVTLHLIGANPDIYDQVHNELVAAFPDEDMPMTAPELENLPYFEACVKEGLRIAGPARLRLPRVVPPQGATHHGHYLPPGTKIHSSGYYRSFDETIFPRPHIFDPNRWLKSDNLAAMNASLVTFSKGPRNCLGQNLALVEIHLFMGLFLRNFAITRLVDPLIIHDGLLADPANPVRVEIRKV